MAESVEPKRSFGRLLWTPIGLLVLALAVMWGIEIVDTLALDDRLQGNGILPRRRDGLDGIVWTPFLHSDFGHIASNSLPLLALGGLVAVRGMRYWALVTLTVIVVGGGLTWALAGFGNHIGASGVVFGYFGAILAAAVFERRPRALASALLVIVFYGGMVAGIVPQEYISWEGHLFGMFAGVIAARAMAEPRRPQATAPDNPEPWELDEPWLN
ncbi:MAG: rhomboid family intramembrane serine protease [Acidimicrobiaceae bacterium]|nr:rhomboid family intramembrane serine protease [Acidimicrobiaceae bacterium]MXW76898.1 rhomboid family intramembrane serine protease [Acidimicrobiaceae bacterium]MYA73298.1 rhomboid family intramembrane serine protease [Acidimicrobiaceae bacterium]MYD05561.1 rhomboid family intramembrane serine protease [Acidimicrobiaceae bacterium]MYG56092.1 rhomboid family intramembrane serine protease [Acidimicrobiaceae bacterium]